MATATPRATMTLLALSCPQGHELALPARMREGVFGPCPCGWTIHLQPPVGMRLGRLAALLGCSPSEVRKLAREGAIRTERPSRPGSHRRVPADEVARLLADGR